MKTPNYLAPASGHGDRLADLNRQIAELTARKRTLLQQHDDRQRRRDTRAKIIIGAAVIGLNERERADALARLLPRLAPRDLAFLREETLGLLGPSAATAPAAPPPPAAPADQGDDTGTIRG